MKWRKQIRMSQRDATYACAYVRGWLLQKEYSLYLSCPVLPSFSHTFTCEYDLRELEAGRESGGGWGCSTAGKRIRRTAGDQPGRCARHSNGSGVQACAALMLFLFFSCVQLLGCYATLLILGATSCCLHGFFFPLSLLMGFPRSHCDMGFFEVCVYANDT